MTAMPASVKLANKLMFDFEKNPLKSVYYEYKKKQMEEGYLNGKGRDSEYGTLRSLFDDTRDPDMDPQNAVLKYLNYVKKLLGKRTKNEYLRDAKDDPDQFQERWNGYLSAFYKDADYYKTDGNGQKYTVFLKKKEKTVSKIADAFSGLILPSEKEIVAGNTDGVLEKIQEEMLRSCIKKAVRSDFENINNKRVGSFDHDLIDLCEERGLLQVDKTTAPEENEETVKNMTVRILEEIYSIEDDLKRNEYDMFFLPVKIDYASGISMCIAGKRTYEGWNNIAENRGGPMAEEWPYPCVLTVLHFTDTSLLRRFSTVSYEVKFPFSKYTKGINRENLEEYYNRINSEYLKSIQEAIKSFHELDLCDEVVGSFTETVLYDRLTCSSKKAAVNEKDKEDKNKELTGKRQKKHLKDIYLK